MNKSNKNNSKFRELIVLCDANGIVRFSSNSFGALFGTAADHFLGKPFCPGGNAASNNKPAHYRTKAQHQGSELIIDWEESRLDGGERLYAGIVINDSDGPFSKETSPIQDINSAQINSAGSKQEDHADAANKKMALLATMSHEMRTPLNGIIGMTRLLIDSGLTPNQLAYAESVRESGTILLSLINDLLDYSKIEAGRMELFINDFDLFQMVQNVAEMLSPRAAEQDIEITAYVDEDIPEDLLGDETKLRQVLMNLAGNSVKFTNKGGVSIEAHLVEKSDETATVKFRVRDTGIGIPAEKHATIFDEFSQAQEGAEASEGTGLGLAISRKIIHAMSGDISLESSPGVGSVFSFEVEFKCGGNKTRDPIVRVETPVIVATDVPVLSESLKLQLLAYGCENVICVHSPEGASKAIDKHPDATLICDVFLTGTNVSELARKAERSFVLVSPLARDRLEELKQSGFDGYFIKPVRQRALHQRLVGRPEENHRVAKRKIPTTKGTANESTTLRVLLAEDNKINAVLATTIIKRLGHEVEVAVNGFDAVRAVDEKEFDVILMDVHMPVVDGLEATKRIRALPSEKATLPIVALTANAMASDRQKCSAAGMDDFISKPFEPNDLAELLRKWGGAKSNFSKAS